MLANRIMMAQNKTIISFVEEFGQYRIPDGDYWGEQNGLFQYTGSKKTVYIPHKIKKKKITSYHMMFPYANIEKVVSDNPDILDMGYMFNNSSGYKLDLSHFITPKVKNMSHMFVDTSYSVIDLSGLNMGSVENTEYMFFGSTAVEVIARSESDSRKILNSIGFPSHTRVIVKG